MYVAGQFSDVYELSVFYDRQFIMLNILNTDINPCPYKVMIDIIMLNRY